MTELTRNRQPLLFMGAALLICLLAYFLLYRHAPGPTRGLETATQGNPVFEHNAHLTAIKADSFTMLLRRVYPAASIQRDKEKLKAIVSGQGARASDFYNDNPYLLKVESKEFSVGHDKGKDEIDATFMLHSEGKEPFIRVPNDILYQLTEKATNAPHG
jgi:hypothetical protein